MNPRIDFHKTSPKAIKAIMAVETYLENSGPETRILGLIKLRASQINGCSFCVNMHYEELRKMGISDIYLNLVSVWKEAPCFSDKERAALRWTEILTLIADADIADEDYKLMKNHFSEKELVDLTVAIGQINVWNRLALSFKYQPQVSAKEN